MLNPHATMTVQCLRIILIFSRVDNPLKHKNINFHIFFTFIVLSDYITNNVFSKSVKLCKTAFDRHRFHTVS